MLVLSIFIQLRYVTQLVIIRPFDLPSELERLAFKIVKSIYKILVEKEKIESQEAIAEMKIAAEREKNVQSSILEADRTYADILNTVREADEKTRTE